MKRFIAIISGILLIASLSYADTPEEVTQSYIDLIQEKQWDEAVELFDPAALRDFRDMLFFLTEMPDDVALLLLAQFFEPGTTKEKVKVMSDKDFVSSFLKGAIAQVEQFGQIQFGKVNILGTVPEGENLRHVLVRTNAGLGDITIESMEVFSLKRTETGWKMLMQAKTKGMAQQIKKMLTQDQEMSQQ